MARILIADTLAKQGIEMLSREHEVEVKTGLSEDELVQAVAGVQALVVRSQTQPFMTVLDCADPSMRVERRTQSISALQALALLNNGFMTTHARHFAARVEHGGLHRRRIPEEGAVLLKRRYWNDGDFKRVRGGCHADTLPEGMAVLKCALRRPGTRGSRSASRRSTRRRT